MKKLVKGLVKGLAVAGVFGLGVLMGANKTEINKTERIEVARIVSESEEGINLEKGEQLIELTDGSFVMYGNGKYSFQPVELGDWNYEVDNAEQLKNIVETYVSLKNNEVKKVSVADVYEQKGSEQVYKGFHLEDGDKLVLFSDDSFAICNEKNNTYVFQPTELGDWDYEVRNKLELENIIKTYLSIKNNEEPVIDNSENVEVEFVWEQKGNVQELDGYCLEDGDIVVELTDGSWAICNEKIDNYIFQPVDLGDWNYELNNAEQLENIIKTYLSIKNTGMY